MQAMIADGSLDLVLGYEGCRHLDARRRVDTHNRRRPRDMTEWRLLIVEFLELLDEANVVAGEQFSKAAGVDVIIEITSQDDFFTSFPPRTKGCTQVFIKELARISVTPKSTKISTMLGPHAACSVATAEASAAPFIRSIGHDDANSFLTALDHEQAPPAESCGVLIWGRLDVV